MFTVLKRHFSLKDWSVFIIYKKMWITFIPVHFTECNYMLKERSVEKRGWIES